MIKRHWRLFLGVWLVALALRLLYLRQIADAPFFDLRLGDAEAYHAWARRIVGGDWVGHAVFYQAPLYPYLLALVYRLIDDSVATVRIVQAVLGAFSCLLLALAGVSMLNDRRGAIAGLLLAIYAPAIFLDGLLEKSSLATFLTAAFIACLAIRPERMTLRRWVLTGIVLGLLSLTRENALLLVAAVLPWIAFGPLPGRSRPLTAAAFLAGCLVVLAPVALRNYAVGREFQLTTAQSGPNFYIGNHAGASGTYEPLVVGHGSAADEQADATHLAEEAAGRRLGAAEVSRYWMGRALDDIWSQPVGWLKLMARKLALAFNAAEIADTESIDVYAEWSPLLRTLRFFDFGVLLALAALAAAMAARARRSPWLLYTIGATYTVSVVAFYVFARYRFPIALVLMMVVTSACQRDVRRYRDAWAAVAALAAFALSHLPLEDARAARATHDADIATALARDPQRSAAAVDFYTRAIAEMPQFAPAHFGLGTLLARGGRTSEAIPHYRAALASRPDYMEAHFNLGKALAAGGQLEEASREYDEALRLRPDDADTRAALAAVHNNLGAALASAGRIAEAIPHFERALEVNPADQNARQNLEQVKEISQQPATKPRKHENR